MPASRVLLVSAFGAFLAFLDATIVNVAFPSIRDSFQGTSIGSLSWVLNAYNIVFAAFLIVCGRLTDLLGRRRAFIAGVVVFTVASALCGAAPTVSLLVAARVLQALGAALLVPASLALVVEAFPEERRAHAIGLWGATAAVAAGLGPPLGGALVQLGGWRWAFLVNLPFGVAAIWAARSSLVESRAPGRRRLPDLRGAALLALCLGVLNLGIVKGGDWGWASPTVVGSFAATAVLLGLFVLSSRAHRSPLLDPALLRIPSFSIASLATVLAGLGFYAYLLTNILWLQYVWHYGVLRAGLALVPGALMAAVVAARLGPLADKHGYRVFVVPGAVVWAGAYVWYHQQVGLVPAFWTEWFPGQIISGIGVGATLPLLGSAALAAVPGGRYATASAVVSSARQLGGVLGIAILVVILGNPTPATAVTAFHHGWVLSICAFLAVAVVSLPLGKLGRVDEPASSDDERPASVHAPLPVAGGPVRALASASDSTDLSDVPLLAALPPDARGRLEEAARLVPVPAGTWLMETGDPAGSAYVVRRGRLEVAVDGRLVRELGPGEVLGELALLTGEPRSASVRARRDSTVLEVPRAAFDDLLATDPTASRTVLTQVAQRLRTAGGPKQRVRPAQPVVIAVVGLHAGAGAAEVAEAVRQRLAVHHRVSAPGVVGAEGLDRAERDHDRVLLVAAYDRDDDATDGPGWRDFCLRQADAVVLVARSNEPPPTAPLTPAPLRQPDVVLHGPAPSPTDLAAWAAATDAWQLTVADEHDLAAGLRPLADRLAGRSLGLVLAGGGARAFAHVGVLRELEDSGLHIDRVAGSSVGAIIAALHAGGRDGDALEETCYAEFVRRKPFSDWGLPTASLARGRRMHDAVVRNFGESVIEGLPRQLHIASTDLVTRTRQVHRRGAVGRAMTASARLPVLFAPIPDDSGRLLIDGGVLDNLPVDLLTERDEGPVVAVNIAMGGGGGGGPRSGRPRVPALGETLLRTMMIGSGGAVAAARAEGAWVLTPPTLGVGLLEFHQLDRMVSAGRTAARLLLEQAGADLGSPDVVPLEQATEPEPPHQASELAPA
ncbi:MDR family MFS transporter/patatin-like phospholipase family protein [Nocardioides cynanchi]|uniref:MDR family MFS transporter/patatin-like phospholipase family protein n=1 Tax=Nocardioides cynanchi TaxID=2558918 RepID=UPI00177F0F68|nr:MDR family MFS transporter/patatin-like phospholipase family protein [Nocardioides cynanchi]